MHFLFLFVNLVILDVVVSSPVDSNGATSKREPEGITLQMKKKGINPLHKRANGVASNNRWWVTLGIGTPPQDLNFLPDSGANEFSVVSTLEARDKQGDAMLYDPGTSSTAEQLPDYSWRQCFGNENPVCFSGPVYKESITAGGQTFQGVPMCVQNDSNQVVNGDRSGNLGMNPFFGDGQPTNPSGLPVFMDSIKSSLPQPVAAYTYNSYTQQGSLDLGFIDSNKYVGELIWLDTIPSDIWKIPIDGLYVNDELVKTPFDAQLDHGTGDARLPRATFDAYFKQISGATWNQDAITYDFPCDADLPDMTFAVGSLHVAIPKYSWIVILDGDANQCRCAMLLSDSEDQGFFGEAWLEGAFVAFNYDNHKIGIANRPAYSTTIPTISIAGSTKFCTGTDFTGTCTDALWQSNTCAPLTNTVFHHNIGSFGPSVGYCTLYNDDHCASPLPFASGIRAPGQSNTFDDGPLVGSFACFSPSDYSIRQSGFLQFCDRIGFQGNCQRLDWRSFECHNLPDDLKNNALSAGPDTGYCYLFTEPGCTNAIEDGAPFVFPGHARFEAGKKVQSFMCM